MWRYKIGRRGFLQGAAAGVVAAPAVASQIGSTTGTNLLNTGFTTRSIGTGLAGSVMSGQTDKMGQTAEKVLQNRLERYVKQLLTKDMSRRLFKTDEMPAWREELDRRNRQQYWYETKAHLKGFKSISPIIRRLWLQEAADKRQKELELSELNLSIEKHQWALAQLALGLPGARERVLRAYQINDPDIDKEDRVRVEDEYHDQF